MPAPFLVTVEIGAGLFVCGLLAILFDAIRTAYQGLKGRAK